jgi:hypothetical protein
MDPAGPRPPELAEATASEQPVGWDEHALRPRAGRDLVPSTDPSGRPRGRHEAPRRLLLPGGLATVVAVVALVLVGGLLATRLIGSAQQALEPSATTAAATAAAGEATPTSRVPGAAAFGNLVHNWSFELAKPLLPQDQLSDPAIYRRPRSSCRSSPSPVRSSRSGRQRTTRWCDAGGSAPRKSPSALAFVL